MKYRQWKKNYKKKHGVNPPLELDKKKTEQTLKPALAGMCESVAAAFNRMAENLREESEDIEE